MKKIIKNIEWSSILKLTIILIVLGAFIYIVYPKYYFLKGGHVRGNKITGKVERIAIQSRIKNKHVTKRPYTKKPYTSEVEKSRLRKEWEAVTSRWDNKDSAKGWSNLIRNAGFGTSFDELVDYYSIVERVIDGDTIKLINGETVRLIGIDTPETVHPKKPVEYFGKEASAFTKRLCEGKRVNLGYEGNEKPKRDKYGRLLAYIYLEDGTLVNAEIIKQGYGHAYTKYPFILMDKFKEYEREARENKRGLWR